MELARPFSNSLELLTWRGLFVYAIVVPTPVAYFTIVSFISETHLSGGLSMQMQEKGMYTRIIMIYDQNKKQLRLAQV